MGDRDVRPYDTNSSSGIPSRAGRRSRRCSAGPLPAAAACPYKDRRALLEELFTDHGLVCNGMAKKYLAGYRGWTKIRRRDTTEAVIGAITGTLARPQLLVLGRHDAAGRLRAVGRTVPLRPEQARPIAEHLTAADPDHPWTRVRFAAAWGSREVLDTVLVRPDLVAEISADRPWTAAASSSTRCAFNGCAWT
ncbi:hypothetical protein [Streptomyces sp. NBC_00454]|uniref:hypothetical protein n=1 Tax=Streptomyces sp. NBC_00454 TaxID=2975747 RepID=UPI0030DF89F2